MGPACLGSCTDPDGSSTPSAPFSARQWLFLPNRALAAEVPLQLLDTDIGARQLEEVLRRLSYGVFS
jgi:uncharacterized protein (DUF2384 family)